MTTNRIFLQTLRGNVRNIIVTEWETDVDGNEKRKVNYDQAKKVGW